MSDVQLRVINESNDQNNAEFVIFSKNTATDTSVEDGTIIWKVIRNVGPRACQSFVYPLAVAMDAEDRWGNHTSQINAEPGQLFAMMKDSSGDVLAMLGQGAAAKQYQIENQLPAGEVTANIYKDGKLFSTKKGLLPGQTAVFEFEPVIYIGAVSQAIEGEVIHWSIMSYINTEISLQGIASADIIVTEGGPDPEARPFEFTLKNVVMA